MALSTTINYDNAANFTLSNTQIDSGVAKLAVTTGSKAFNQAFSSSTGFTFNATNTEFTGGLVRKKDQLPANALVGATYASTQNLNWDSTSASLTGTLFGGATVSAGKLVATGSANKGVYYENANIASSGTTGAIKLKYTPNYTGSPATNTNIVSMSASGGSANDRLVFFHSPSGNNLRVTAYNNVGTAVHVAATFGGVSFTSGTQYELEFNWDSSTGAIRAFVDGVLVGSSPATTYTRGTSANRLYVGASQATYQISNASFDDVILYTEVQHTSGYTPGYTLPETRYFGDTITLPAFSHAGPGTLVSMTSLVTTEAGNPRYTMRVGAGTYMYWNGSAWAASDGTYAQANPKATFTANLPTFPISGETAATVRIHTTSDNTLSSVDDLTLNYTGNVYASQGTIIPNSTVSAQQLLTFSASSSTPASTDVKYQVKVGASLKYWNGSAWVASDGTYAQSSTAAEVNTNGPTLLSANENITIQAVLQTSDVEVTPTLTSTTFTYDFGGVQPGAPTTCTVYGYLLDLTGAVVVGATVSAQLNRGATIYTEASSNVIAPIIQSTTTDSNGYWELELIRSSQFQVDPGYKLTIAQTGSFTYNKTPTASVIPFTVPDQASVNIADLV